jgi:SAM-dependent methyltransferase
MTTTTLSTRDWAHLMLRRSPLKQRKFDKIVSFIGDTTQRVCLDLGSDNGVISLLLRERGGTWHSADLIPETVDAIRTMVGERVDLVRDDFTPYADGQFDLVVVVDLLEHLERDQLFAQELARIVRPGGQLVVNVPNPREGMLRRLRFWLGQTDEAHGHVRPGYSLPALERLFGDYFEFERHHSYSRVCSELVDTVITGALDLLKGSRGKKGTVVTANDTARMQKSFALFAVISPILRLMVRLDEYLPWMHGNMLIASARRR